MPANTAMPMLMRAAAPAPLAITSGTTPRMNAKAVIMIGPEAEPRALRGRVDQTHAFPLVVLLGELHDQDGVLGGQTHQRHDADLDVDVVFQTDQR